MSRRLGPRSLVQRGREQERKRIVRFIDGVVDAHGTILFSGDGLVAMRAVNAFGSRIARMIERGKHS